MTSRRAFLRSAAAALVGGSLLLAGCTSAIQSGYGTALDAVDLEEMTDRMADSITADRRVRAALDREGALRVVVKPIENRMTGEVLPRGEAEMFTARLRALLTHQAPDDFVWVMNRDTLDRLRGEEGRIPLGPNPEDVNPRYALWGRFNSLTDESSTRRSSYYLCTFELTDLDRRTILWTDSYHVKKAATKRFLD